MLEMIDIVAKTTEKDIPYEIVARRSGDVAVSLANPKKAEVLFGWKAKRTVDEAIKD